MKRKGMAMLLAMSLMTSMILGGCSGEDTNGNGSVSGSGFDGGGTTSQTSSSGNTAGESGYSLPDQLVYRVGFVNIDNSDPNCYPAALNFQNYVQSQEFTAAIGADSVEVLIADSAQDIEKQATCVETLLTKGVDMMFIIGVDTEGNTACVETCNAEGVPVFMVGTEATGGSWRFIGFDEVEYGATQGQWCVDNLPENAKICLLEGTAGREASVKRKQGVEEALAAREDLEIIASQPGDFEAAASMQVTEDWITAYGDEIDCIIAADNKEASGAVEALNQNKMLDQVQVVGVVCLPEDTAAIEDGSWAAGVLCYWPSIGELCGQVCKAMYLGEEVEERTNIELYAIDKTNMDELSKKVFGE